MTTPTPSKKSPRMTPERARKIGESILLKAARSDGVTMKQILAAEKAKAVPATAPQIRKIVDDLHQACQLALNGPRSARVLRTPPRW